MNKHYFTAAFLSMVLMAALISCDSKRVYEEYASLPDQGWNKDSLATFVVHINDLNSRYNLYIHIRNKVNYPNSNLWIFIDVTTPSGQTFSEKLECLLADKNGKWLGRGWGSIYFSSFRYKNDMQFKELGKYTFKLTHGMRSNHLEGIQDIGMRIEKSY